MTDSSTKKIISVNGDGCRTCGKDRRGNRSDNGRQKKRSKEQIIMDLKTKFNWNSDKKVSSKTYNCGYCGNFIASCSGYDAGASSGKGVCIYICHFCTRPTFFDQQGEQFPGASFGGDVANIDDPSVQKLYREARDATAKNCNTAAVLCCRKLLMHIAVAKGAKPNQTFASYVDYLDQQHLIPPDAKTWVDHIRKQGNEANHEINIMTRETAEELISFLEMLLKIIYEFPAIAKRKYGAPEQKENP